MREAKAEDEIGRDDGFYNLEGLKSGAFLVRERGLSLTDEAILYSALFRAAISIRRITIITLMR